MPFGNRVYDPVTREKTIVPVFISNNSNWPLRIALPAEKYEQRRESDSPSSNYNGRRDINK